jgi:uncharacterized zinc-type alcohol dehydrogenase-like protein
MQTPAYAAPSATEDLIPHSIERRDLSPTDIDIEITHCGVCHSDLHTARNDWGGTKYPVVPGHEIIGVISEVGEDVKGFQKGDVVGVGCMVDSCHSCPACKQDLEQFCENGATYTYNSPDKHLGGRTFGGYSTRIVVDQSFVLQVPKTLDPAAAAPLLCAGITTYSPLRHWKVGKGDTVGVIGLGGLGHMGIKFAKALGAEVVMITRSPDKADDAKALGADSILLSTDEEQMKNASGTFDFLLNTIPVSHDVNPYLNLMRIDGTMVMVGAIEPLEGIHGGNLVRGRKRIAGSLIGGIKETQEMLDFCGEHNIVSDIEMINMDEINTAYERMLKSDVKYRFVIDMESLKSEG